ncbi:MAG: GGDEF domain-containing protein [Bacillota bacterium]|nr:GGDEF domain-containing protein [Bacillota bacterium]
MSDISEIMTRELVTVTPNDCVGRVVSLMEQFKIGGMPVLAEGRVVGIVTSRDVRRSHPNRLVADAMNSPVVTVLPTCSLWEADRVLRRYGIERLVVVEKGSLVGLVTKSRLSAELGKHLDSLTGLSRAEFIKRKAQELVGEGKDVTVLFLDLDDFGAIDKELGHVQGDEILRRVADILKRMVRPGADYLGRYAGDEFAVVTTRSLDDAVSLAGRMVSAIGEEQWPQGAKVTGSAGVAGWKRISRHNGGRTVEDLINLASLACTKAKRCGEPVVVAGDGPGFQPQPGLVPG